MSTKKKSTEQANAAVAAVRRRPTRRDLLIVIARLQGYIGSLNGISRNDRDRMQQDKMVPMFQEALELCIDARGFDPPLDGQKSKQGWGVA